MTLALNAFSEKLADHGFGYLCADDAIPTLQINVGKLCNQACKHCHVEAGPKRTEIMTRETVDQVLGVLRRFRIPVVDITGGAPELNPSFRYLVAHARDSGARVIVRHNFTVQFTSGNESLPEFFRDHEVELVASLPYFLAHQTDSQRGSGVFEQSIQAMRRLNDLGYGREGSGLVMNLVYNPVGAFLPPEQDAIERDFRRELAARYDLHFNRLYTITNMPIRRFLDYLHRSGNYDRYMLKLVNSFNPRTVEGLMCRSLISVGWDGTLYDCDFNQMLDLSVGAGLPRHIAELDLERFSGRRIVTGNHCFGCTAGSGSSCGGAVA